MLSIVASLIGSLELAIMECFWERSPQTSGDILTALRKHRTIAPSTVTTTLVRLCEQGLLTRVLSTFATSGSSAGHRCGLQR
jgi:predicted transcriptional regulator